MSPGLRVLTDKLRDRRCFSQESTDEPMCVLNVGAGMLTLSYTFASTRVLQMLQTTADSKDDTIVEAPCFSSDELDKFLENQSMLSYKLRV
jgi:hypothetical protein